MASAPEIIIDPQSSKLGLSSDVVGQGGAETIRMVYALGFNEYETGSVNLYSGGYLADFASSIIGDIDGIAIGETPAWVNRMPLSRRYSPEHAPGDTATFGMSFENLFPKDVEIATASLAIFTNEATPAPVTDLVAGPVSVQGRVVYASVSGGTAGTDYQLAWTASGDGIVATRTALILCAPTS